MFRDSERAADTVDRLSEVVAHFASILALICRYDASDDASDDAPSEASHRNGCIGPFPVLKKVSLVYACSLSDTHLEKLRSEASKNQPGSGVRSLYVATT